MASPSRIAVKGPNAFRTISETAEAVGAPQHVLRFWETKFSFLTPVKRAGGRRFYRPQDVTLLKAVRRLLHDEGLTIKGVQRVYADQGLARLIAYGGDETDALSRLVGKQDPTQGGGDRIRLLLSLVESARARLDRAIGG